MAKQVVSESAVGEKEAGHQISYAFESPWSQNTCTAGNKKQEKGHVECYLWFLVIGICKINFGTASELSLNTK